MKSFKAGRSLFVRFFIFGHFAIVLNACTTDHPLRFGSHSKLKIDPLQAWQASSLTQKLSDEFKQGGDTLSILNKVFQGKQKRLFASIPFQTDLNQLIQLDTSAFQKLDQKTVSVHNVECQAILRKLKDSWSYTLYFYESENASPLKLDLRLHSESEAQDLFKREPDFLAASFE